MFEGRKFKAEAKEQLKGNWKVPALITFIVFLLQGLVSGTQRTVYHTETLYGSSVSVTISIVGTIVNGILTLAMVYYYINLKKDKANTTFHTFLDGLNMWFKGMCAQLWQSLWIFLWILLLIIPGIVKAFAYSQMFYILAENPTMSVRKAMKISMAMTKGAKGDLFVMGFSFIGWVLLGIITLGIGFLWIIPYMNLAFTNCYAYLKEDAIRRNLLTAEDFT